MSTNARLLFAGVLTSVIVAGGFGSSLLAQSRIRQPVGYQSPASSHQLTPVRVILPASAEPAQPPRPSAVPAAESASQAQAVVRPAPTVKRIEAVDRPGPAVDERRHRRQRYAERKSRMVAARAQMERRAEPGILAFGDDEPRGSGF